MEKYKKGDVIASGSGSLWKVEQTVIPKSWYELVKHFEQFTHEDIAEMMAFFNQLDKNASKAKKKDGINRENALIDAIKTWQSNNAGTDLVNQKHAKNDQLKEEIRKIAVPIIERGMLKHNTIAKQIYDKGISGRLSMKFVLGVVKELCAEMDKEHLIIGRKKK